MRYWYRTQYETYFGKTAGRYAYKWGFVFCCFVDRCLVDIYSASQYFHYFGKIVFSTNIRRPSYELLLENKYFDKSGALLMQNLNKFCSNNNLILYIGKMSLYEDIYYGSLPNKTHFYLFIFWWHQIFSFPFCFRLLIFPTLQWHIHLICSRENLHEKKKISRYVALPHTFQSVVLPTYNFSF